MIELECEDELARKVEHIGLSKGGLLSHSLGNGSDRFTWRSERRVPLVAQHKKKHVPLGRRKSAAPAVATDTIL
jgi:hypothetical protein